MSGIIRFDLYSAVLRGPLAREGPFFQQLLNSSPCKVTQEQFQLKDLAR